jgi:thiamine-phosphate pyrophosphorylase
MTNQPNTTSVCQRPIFPKGLYGITPEWKDIEKLDDAIHAAAAGGMKVLQLRNKTADPSTRLVFTQRLLKTCNRLGVLFILNDDWRLVQQLGKVGPIGAHIGRDDGDSQVVREALGNAIVLGVSCYDDLDRAVAVTQAISDNALHSTDMATSIATLTGPTVDYVAFGAMFSSNTKPGAPPASLHVLTQARQHWQHHVNRPALVAIGGITVHNASTVVQAGADSLAVAGGLFLSPHIEQTARRFTEIIHQSLT